MKKFAATLISSVLILSSPVNAEGNPEYVRSSLESGKVCSAYWGVESSKPGQKTRVHGVRKMNGKTQYQVEHSAEYEKIWTWDFRIERIECK